MTLNRSRQTSSTQILRNRYYIGYVAWRGVEYPGSHEPLIEVELFERVQELLRNHRQSSARPQRHVQYLTGTLFCARRGSRLGFTRSTGRHGGKCDYWLCLGRHTSRTDCDLPSLPYDTVEQAVVREWQDEQLSEDVAAEIRAGLLASGADKQREALTERVRAIKRDRLKWAEKAMDETVPADIARE